MSAVMPMDVNGLENLERIIKSGRIPHAFLIEGSSPEKRLETAKYIAKSVVCVSRDKPCDNCPQCKTVNIDSNPDVTFVVPEKDKKTVTVDQIRALRSETVVLPHAAERRVFIIKDALQLNEQGQNALLKTLEEPPETVVFVILVDSKASLLPTVVSRCSIFLLSDDSPESDDIAVDSREFISLLFDNKEYEMLLSTRKYENDRTKAKAFLDAIKIECVRQLRSEETSKYRSKVLSRIYDEAEYLSESLPANINLTLLFTAMVCKFKSFIK